MNKSLITVIGFLLFLFGVIALVLSLVGLQLSLLSWIDGNKGLGLLVKLLMVIIGLVMVYVAKTSEAD